MGTKASKCWIDPDPCIECEACKPVCPVEAIVYCD